MKKKVKVIAASTTVLIITSMLITPQQDPLNTSNAPDIRPVCDYALPHRDNTPPTENKPLVGEETAEISAHREDFTEPVVVETPPPQPAEKEKTDIPSAPATEIPAEPTIEPTSEPPTPKMGDTRVVDGQKQVYFLGFGWIEDNDSPNECIYLEDMYENGNKVGIIGGSIIGESDGDINKMVGIM